MRDPRAWRVALEEDRLLVLSLFPSTRHRSPAQLAAQCNDLVAALAAQVFIAHTSQAARPKPSHELAASAKPLLILDIPANANMAEMRARFVRTKQTDGATIGLSDFEDEV